MFEVRAIAKEISPFLSFRSKRVKQIRTLRLVASVALFLSALHLWETKALANEVSSSAPKVMLAEKYSGSIDLTEYWVSEKLDGVRARWDGEKLISRGGNVFQAPDWFVASFPDVALDGELWAGRETFEEVSSIVRRSQPHEGWRNVRLMVFDLPESDQPFSKRLAVMQNLVAESSSPYLALIEQFRVRDEEELMNQLEAIVGKGGEGVMLHLGSAYYHAGRSDDLLKLKKFEDEEAVVLGYNPGKGKNSGLVGSLKVRGHQGEVFNIGSGLSDQDRKEPPKIGSTITYKFTGRTDTGLPRFPVFLRVRDEEPDQ